MIRFTFHPARPEPCYVSGLHGGADEKPVAVRPTHIVVDQVMVGRADTQTVGTITGSALSPQLAVMKVGDHVAAESALA